MTYTPEQLEAAAEVYAERMHQEQADKAGQPYIDHLRRVAERMPTYDLRIVAWLHDIVEDTYTSLAQIREAFGPEIGGAVDAITRRTAERYSDYIRRVGENPMARAVKIADLIDNSNLSRLSSVTLEDVKRQRKYNRALTYLFLIDEQNKE